VALLFSAVRRELLMGDAHLKSGASTQADPIWNLHAENMACIKYVLGRLCFQARTILATFQHWLTDQVKHDVDFLSKHCPAALTPKRDMILPNPELEQLLYTDVVKHLGSLSTCATRLYGSLASVKAIMKDGLGFPLIVSQKDGQYNSAYKRYVAMRNVGIDTVTLSFAFYNFRKIVQTTKDVKPRLAAIKVIRDTLKDKRVETPLDLEKALIACADESYIALTAVAVPLPEPSKIVAKTKPSAPLEKSVGIQAPSAKRRRIALVTS
jgi:hypothetical protein